jgi:hypothetical protein
VRVEGTVELAYLSGQLAPSCHLEVRVATAAGMRVGTSSATKYLTPALAAIAMRGELVLELPAGAYREEVVASCARDGENTGLRIVGGGGRLLTDVFAGDPTGPD